MATSATWTVVFDDKMIIKRTGEFDVSNAPGYVINDDAFWNQSKFSNIWAIQYENPVASDQVEYRDTTPHSSYEDANLGDFQDFIDRWDAAHLAHLQDVWDNDDRPLEDVNGESDKIARLGPRPTSYSS
jgi:hypothetical protein|tara:strand:- start:237 stop:623 length:387 start_codon:yes stop_codon:yes gene_type:complete